MKLRIRDNSVRLRLTRAEVDALHRDGTVSAATGFPGGRRLKYSVESSPAIVNPAAFFSDNEITVRLPESAVLAWATSQTVALRGEQRLDDGETLVIVAEKDFACLADHGEDEDQADKYPHPAADKVR